MARKTETIVFVTDDLDGSNADRTIAFAYDGTSYEIDLNKKNASAFDKAIAPWVKAARKAPRSGATRRAGSRGRTGARTDLSEIRAWAKANGHDVSERGRIAKTVQDAYDAVH